MRRSSPSSLSDPKDRHALKTVVLTSGVSWADKPQSFILRDSALLRLLRTNGSVVLRLEPTSPTKPVRAVDHRVFTGDNPQPFMHRDSALLRLLRTNGSVVLRLEPTSTTKPVRA